MQWSHVFSHYYKIHRTVQGYVQALRETKNVKVQGAWTEWRENSLYAHFPEVYMGE